MLLQHQINPSSPDYTDFQFVKYVALNATQYSVFQNTPYAKRDARYVERRRNKANCILFNCRLVASTIKGDKNE